MPILAVETFGAHSFHSAVRAGELVTLPDITSIAKTLGSKTVCKAAFESSKTHPIEPLVVTDKMAVQACVSFAGKHIPLPATCARDHHADHHRMLVEPACGATLSVLNEPELHPHIRTLVAHRQGPVVAIVCGGNGISTRLLEDWKAEYGCV